jgi:nucleotide-binding universal stress UspA family protein
MTPDTTPIIVGIDGSGRSLDAVALAARLADPGQHALLVHVRRSGWPSNLTALQEFLDPATAREMRVVSDSSPARGLQAIAEEIGASLIVVGSSHRSGIGRVFVGSVAESLLAGAPVPVAVAPHGYAGADNRLATIGCGFDGSPESEEALAWAAALARRGRARLQAFAVHSRVAFGAVSTTGAFGYRSADDALRDELEQRMRAALAELPDGSDISGGVLEGDAATELAAASAELDLLVLGSRGYGSVRSALLGSVSRALVRSAACPVVVVPAGSTVAHHPSPAAPAVTQPTPAGVRSLDA